MLRPWRFSLKKHSRRKNGPERDFEERAWGAGRLVTKRGWPDFILQRGDEVFMVEVKPRKMKSYPKVAKKQQAVHDLLRSFGIRVLVWSLDIGFWDNGGHTIAWRRPLVKQSNIVVE